MKLKYYIETKRFLWCVLSAAIMGVLYHFSTIAENDISTVFGSYETIIGYSDFIEISPMNFRGLFLIFILAFPIMNYFVKDFSITATYIFTRIKSKARLIIVKQATLLFYCFISAASYFGVKLTLGGYTLELKHICIDFMVFWLFLTVVCSSVCTFSLIFGTVKSYTISLIVNSLLCLSVTVYYLNYSVPAQWLFVIFNPVAHFMLNWKTELCETLSEDGIKLMNPEADIAYFLIILAALYAISVAAIKNNNIGIKFFDEE